MLIPSTLLCCGWSGSWIPLLWGGEKVVEEKTKSHSLVHLVLLTACTSSVLWAPGKAESENEADG